VDYPPEAFDFAAHPIDQNTQVKFARSDKQTSLTEKRKRYLVSTIPTEWCCVPVIIDNETSELFKLASPDEDPDQQITFRVTQSTADLLPQDFDRYEPSLQRMVDNWRAQKERLMQMKPANERGKAQRASASNQSSQ